MKETLRRAALRLPPLEVDVVDLANGRGPDAVLAISWGGKTHRFVVEMKGRSTPLAFQTAAHQAKRYALEAAGSHPLILLPYLSPSQLDEAEKLGVSALDLCGNGIVQIPHEWIVARSGNPNRFRGSEPLRGVYRGVASLVARAFLANPEFARVSDVHSFIQKRGGAITLATVSKSLARLEEDLIVVRSREGLRLLQADKLLAKLRDNYQPPLINAQLVTKARLAPAALHEALRGAATKLDASLVLTGMSSASKQTTMATEPVSSFYCSCDPGELLRAAGMDASPEAHFPDLELLHTDDVRVYFDARRINEVYVASPVQTFLELALGDKRSQEAATQLGARLLREIEASRGKGGDRDVE